MTLFASAGAFWYVLGRFEAQRRSRIEGLVSVERRRPAFSLYDSTTGLCAAWYFKLRLQEEVTRASRYDTPFGLMLINAAVPDDGKATGRVVAAMSRTFRAADLMGHIDTESRFGVLLTNTNAEACALARERIVAALGEGDATVGLACFPKDAKTWRELLTKAGASPTELYGLGFGEASGGDVASLENVVSIEEVRRVLAQRGA